MRSILFCLALLTAGCESSTPYGDCIGITDDPVPGLVYKVSARNVVLSIVFFQTIFAPAVFLLSDFKCPVAQEPVKK